MSIKLQLFLRCCYLVGMGTLLAARSGWAQSGTCMLVPVALDQRVQAAALVVEARVTSQRAEAAPGV
jgi:hypothetical protein